MKLIYDSGFDVYAIVRRDDGYVYNHATGTFEAWLDDNLTGEKYDFELTDVGGDMYDWTFPLPVSSDVSIIYYLKAGSVPANTDMIITDKGSI